MSDAYRVNPDVDTIDDIISSSRMLNKWIKLRDQYGENIWFISVEHIVEDKWVIRYGTDNPADSSHLISTPVVYQKIKNRWPDVSLHTKGPIEVDGI